MARDLRMPLLAVGFGVLASGAGADTGRDVMPQDLQERFPSEQYARAVWLDCTTGSMRMRLAMDLLAGPETDYGAVHHILEPFAAGGSSFALVEALSGWVEDRIDPDVIASRFRMQCVSLAAEDRT